MQRDASAFGLPLAYMGGCRYCQDSPHSVRDFSQGHARQRFDQTECRSIKMAWIELVEKTNLKGASAIHVTSLIEATEIRRFGWSLPHLDGSQRR
jgi:hypothetical protein